MPWRCAGAMSYLKPKATCRTCFGRLVDPRQCVLEDPRPTACRRRQSSAVMTSSNGRSSWRRVWAHDVAVGVREDDQAQALRLAWRSAGRVSGNGCQARIERTNASPSFLRYGQPRSAQNASRLRARTSRYGRHGPPEQAELDGLPAVAQDLAAVEAACLHGAARAGRGSVAGASLPVHERAVAVERRDADVWARSCGKRTVPAPARPRVVPVGRHGTMAACPPSSPAMTGMPASTSAIGRRSSGRPRCASSMSPSAGFQPTVLAPRSSTWGPEPGHSAGRPRSAGRRRS